MALPSGYTKLGSLKSTGTQYINSNFIADENTRIVCKAVVHVGSDTNYLFGARGSTSKNRFIFAASMSGYYAIQYGSQAKNFDTSFNSTETIVVEINKNVATLTLSDGRTESVTFSAQTISTAIKLLLFACNTNGTIKCGTVEIIECQIYDNGVLVRDYVPALRTQDSVAGLYDLQNDDFYTNAGTGVFDYTSDTEAAGGHKTLIDDTAYEIKGGKVLINGTIYDVALGKALIDGTVYEIAFGSQMVTFRIIDDGTILTFTAPENMLWSDWIYSEYNTIGVDQYHGFYHRNDGYITYSGDFLYELREEYYVEGHHAITASDYESTI